MLAGVLAALNLFKQLDTALLTKALGVFVIGYAVYTLSDLHPGQVPAPSRTAPLGGLGALVGTLFGTGGPFYVVYLQMWGPTEGPIPDHRGNPIPDRGQRTARRLRRLGLLHP